MISDLPVNILHFSTHWRSEINNINNFEKERRVSNGTYRFRTTKKTRRIRLINTDTKNGHTVHHAPSNI